MQKTKYLSLFSGIGGFELGIQRAYENNLCGWNAITQQSRRCPSIIKFGKAQSISCIGFSEIDTYATAIYQQHFPSHRKYGDITTINERKLPDFDLLVGGFPCQSFSIAGKRGGFKDTRGTMFFEIVRIVSVCAKTS